MISQVFHFTLELQYVDCPVEEIDRDIIVSVWSLPWPSDLGLYFGRIHVPLPVSPITISVFHSLASGYLLCSLVGPRKIPVPDSVCFHKFIQRQCTPLVPMWLWAARKKMCGRLLTHFLPQCCAYATGPNCPVPFKIRSDTFPLESVTKCKWLWGHSTSHFVSEYNR